MIQVFKYQESPIQFEVIDGQVMANATQMAEACGKKMDGYLRRKSTKEYIGALELRYANLRIIKVQQGKGKIQGTWIHEKLVLDFSRWLSPTFAIWCDEKISELLRTGSVTVKENPRRAIEKHVDRPVQIQNSKDINAVNFIRGGVEKTIEYNRKSCFLHTGHLPHELTSMAKKEGLPAKFRKSGKEVIRYYRPDIAASMSLTDELCKRGNLSLKKAASMSKQVIPVFAELIKQGMIES